MFTWTVEEADKHIIMLDKVEYIEWAENQDGELEKYFDVFFGNVEQTVSIHASEYERFMKELKAWINR